MEKLPWVCAITPGKAGLGKEKLECLKAARKSMTTPGRKLVSIVTKRAVNGAVRTSTHGTNGATARMDVVIHSVCQ